jgi:CubicO group peptidase (beta-lactamase class C family)
MGQHRRRRVRPLWSSAVIVALNFLLVPCWACDDSPTSADYRFPLAEEHDIDVERLAEAYISAERSDRINSLLVERDGVLVAEAYFRGYGPQSLNTVWSVTKSFNSALIGIAIDEGYIESVDQAIGDFLGPVVPNLEPAKSSITIRQLLTMSCGLPWVEEGLDSEYMDWIASDDHLMYVLDKPLVYSPGERFDYSDGAAHLASAVLSEAVGMTAHEFARVQLFDPLDFGPTEWSVDNRGYNFGGVGLGVSSRDMVKFGRLYLDGGAFDGQRILSSEWVDESTRGQIRTDPNDPDSQEYGYFWWIDGCGAHSCYRASGYAGQLVFAVPDLDLVVVITSDWRGDRNRGIANWYNAYVLVVYEVLPAVR